MAVIDTEGLLKGRRLRKCSAEARWYWPYLFLLSNGYARIELDYDSIADEFSSFRSSAPNPEKIEQAFAEYQTNHLIFVYAVNDQEWGQWDTRRSLLKDYKTAGDNSSPNPPEDAYRQWLIEQHGEEWPQFHWNKNIVVAPFDQSLPKFSPNVDRNFPADCYGVGVGVGSGSGKGKEKTKGASAFVLPDWIPQEPWNAYLDMRKKLRKPATDYAKEKLVKKLTKFKKQGLDLAAILDQSTINGWADIYEPKEGSAHKQAAPTIPLSQLVREQRGEA